jgi:hypothetical protein
VTCSTSLPAYVLQCMTSWREGLHNLCPSCPNPISTGVFTLHYIGTCKLSAPPTAVSLPGLVADMAACSCSFVHSSCSLPRLCLTDKSTFACK